MKTLSTDSTIVKYTSPELVAKIYPLSDRDAIRAEYRWPKVYVLDWTDGDGLQREIEHFPTVEIARERFGLLLDAVNRNEAMDQSWRQFIEERMSKAQMLNLHDYIAEMRSLGLEASIEYIGSGHVVSTPIRDSAGDVRVILWADDGDTGSDAARLGIYAVDDGQMDSEGAMFDLYSSTLDTLAARQVAALVEQITKGFVS